MFSVIAGAIAVIGSLAAGLISKGSNKNAQIDASNQALLDYDRQRTLGIYGLVQNEKQTLLLIIGLGFGLLAFIFYMNKRNS